MKEFIPFPRSSNLYTTMFQSNMLAIKPWRLSLLVYGYARKRACVQVKMDVKEYIKNILINKYEGLNTKISQKYRFTERDMQYGPQVH